LKLSRYPRSFAATLVALPSISEIPFLDSIDITAIRWVIVARTAVWRIRSSVSQDQHRFVSRCNGAPCLAQIVIDHVTSVTLNALPLLLRPGLIHPRLFLQPLRWGALLVFAVSQSARGFVFPIGGFFQ